MTWTPDAPPISTWARETSSSATWSPDTPPFAAWEVDIGADLQRITEDTIRRVTEDGSTIRIVERFRLMWNADAPPTATWE